ncbi:SWIM zinc finger family protein [Rubrobacter aplysinae]|uniref:SWIM zinc finger family protein n=1 Tax=Rubrobacter aplysinae TaxID=909625 RepID=UPI00064C452B|nr:SWIM zinc finger family protein [Rubrobacter aplysinae]
MAEVSVHERARAERAMRLYNERGEEIRKVGPQTYLVPGCSADAYTVDLREETCTCPDYQQRCSEDGLLCKHIYAAVIYREKAERARRYCDYRFLELLEEDYGIRQFHLRTAFMGVPARKLDAIAVCEQATAETDDPEDAGDLIRQWAKERKVGSYHPHIIGAPPLTFGGRTGY